MTLQEQAEYKLASLRDQLNQKKAVKQKNEPGAILATRAAAVAESTHKKKKKSGEKALDILKKAFKDKTVKEEPDYGDEAEDAASGESSDSDEDDEKFLGEGLGGSSAAGKQRKLRLYSEKKPGKLLAAGFERMHDQVGTHYGSVSSKKQTLEPVALRYLLSFALPQFQGGVSHARYRELRTLATSLDLMVEGKAGSPSTEVQKPAYVPT